MQRLLTGAQTGGQLGLGRVELRRGKQPVAQLVALPRAGAERRKPGALAGQITLGEDFDALPAELLSTPGTSDLADPEIMAGAWR